MHIHGGMNLNSPGVYSAAGAEKAAAEHRAAEVRRKLAKNAQAIEGAAASPEEGFLLGRWMDARHSQVLSEDQYHPSAAGRDPDFG